MKDKTTEIRFSPYNPELPDCDCRDGELEIGTSTFGTDSSTCHRIVAQEICRPDGETICIHCGRIIVWRDNILYWAPFPAATPLSVIGAAGRPVCSCVNGDTIAVQHDSAIHYYIWEGRGYEHLTQLYDIPVIEFGLRSVGMMSGVAHPCVDNGLVAGSTVIGNVHDDSGVPGSGASTPHPATGENSGIATTAAGKSLIDIYTSALDSRVYQHGHFAQPFFVRYAMRDHHDNYIAVSAPVLMLPTVLPPRLTVAGGTIDSSKGVATIDIDLSGNRICSLCYRLTQPLSRQWFIRAQAIDIFVTPQIPTYNPSSDHGHISAYGDMVRRTDNGAPNRGREITASPSYLDGHYSLGNDIFTEHYISDDSMHTEVWWVEPNPHLCADIIGAADFYRVASIDCSALNASADFSTLTIDNTSEKALRANRRLDPSEGNSVNPVPTSMYTLGKRIIAAGGGYHAPKPYPWRSLAAFAGDASENSDYSIYNYVYTRHGDTLTATKNVSSAMPTPLSAHFPRFLYHPDPAATLMQIAYDGDIYEVPLRRHEKLGGAYWFGGLDISHAPAIAANPVMLQSPSLLDSPRPSTNTVYVSTRSNPWIFPSADSLEVGAGDIITLRAALKSPDNGLFGKFPLYAFSTDGIYMLEYDAATKRFASSTLVSTDVVATKDAVAPSSDGIFYLSGGYVKSIKGSSVICVFNPAEFRLFDISRLPHAARLITSATKVPITSVPPASAILYIPTLDAIAAYSPGVEGALFYFLTHRTACAHDCAIAHAIDNSTTVQMSDYSISDFNLCAGGALIITRPIRLGTMAPKRPICITLWGDDIGTSTLRWAVYGSDHLRRWHLIGTSARHFMYLPHATRYRFYRLAIYSDTPLSKFTILQTTT